MSIRFTASQASFLITTRPLPPKTPSAPRYLPVVMSRQLDEVSTLSASRVRTKLIEGSIWWPRETSEAADRDQLASRRGCASGAAITPSEGSSVVSAI